MTASAGAVPVSPIQLSEKDRHTILENVLAALKKRFYAPEKLNADWDAAVEQHRPLIESAATADAFEEAVSALLEPIAGHPISASSIAAPAGRRVVPR